MTLDAGFSKRAVELLTAAKQLLDKQKTADVVLNMLTTTVFYDDAQCDGYCLIDDIDAFLNDCGF
jgi:hypothetical protein